MKKYLIYITLAFAAMLTASSCHERYVTYDDAEYVMFADTIATYPVQQDVEYFSIPVVSTVTRDYDRTFGVEIVDKGNNAIEGLHYRLQSNTVTIKAGETRADVMVHGIYDNIEAEDQLTFQLRLVMNDDLVMPLYGKDTKANLMKVCPFDINAFTGYCVFTSMFLYDYSITGSYQRLVYTAKHPTEENTIICRNWLNDGYDVTMKFHTEDQLTFQLRLVMNDDLVMPLYGKDTKAQLMKVCPFDINAFTGYCVFTSMFLYDYSLTGSYQRLVYTEKHPTEENTIICRNWLNDGYDVTMKFHPEDPLRRVVTMDEGQVASDEGSFFGTAHGDDKILVRSSSINESLFFTCGSYLYLWAEIYVEHLGAPVGTVGHFYNIMEWISDEEAERLRNEGM